MKLHLNKIPGALAVLLLLMICSACQQEEKLIASYSDNFDTNDPMWNTKQISDSARFVVVDDPKDPNNKCLKFGLLPEDFNAGKRRNELVLRAEDTIGYTVSYSFRFMLPKEFFKDRAQDDWIMLQQWHDEPPRGKTWAEYAAKSKPPVSLFLTVGPDQKCVMQYTYGLKDKYKNEKKFIKLNQDLLPDTWYTFSNEIYWSMDSTGYSIPKLNDKYLAHYNNAKADPKLKGRNMYNDVPNYYKMGLYGNQLTNDTIHVYYDEFNYVIENR